MPDTLNKTFKHMNKFLFLIILCWFSSASAEPEADENTAETDSEQTETKKDKQVATTVKTPDTFDPTETLSQDVPTAFPIDI